MKILSCKLSKKKGTSYAIAKLAPEGGILWSNYADAQGTWITLNNVNGNILKTLSNRIAEGQGMLWGNLKWNVLGYSCVNQTSRSLWYVGVPTLPINFHPHILNFQLLVRQLGIYSSPYLYDR